MDNNKLIEEYKSIYSNIRELFQDKVEKISSGTLSLGNSATTEETIKKICSSFLTPLTKQSYVDYYHYAVRSEFDSEITPEFKLLFSDILNLFKEPTPKDFNIDHSTEESINYPIKFTSSTDEVETIYYFNNKDDLEKFQHESDMHEKALIPDAINAFKPLLKLCYGNLLYEHDEM